MEQRWYHIRISPENVNTVFRVNYDLGTNTPIPIDDPCCDITTTTTTGRITGFTYVYSSMSEVVSGGTNGISLLTGLTVPILLTENTVDIGYYSVFDGYILQKDTMMNFIFSGFGNSINFTNTSDKEFKKYLEFSDYKIDWGDGVIQYVNNTTPNFYSHTYAYSNPTVYTITMSGMSPWGWNVLKKDVYIPITGTTIDNPNGNVVFHPMGGNWSATPISYDYIFSGDSECILPDPYFDDFGPIPFYITGYTQSTINDLEVYGPKSSLLAGKYSIGVPVTGTSGVVGIVYGPSLDNTYTAYTINDINYYDLSDGRTLFVVETSGLTIDDLVCSAITKNEVLLNVIDEPQVQSNVYIERGKNSALESVQRLGEIDNIGDLEKYGYKFFVIIKT